MRITLRLIGIRKGDTSVVHIKLESPDGKTPRDQKTVFNYIQRNSPVQGLEYEMKGGGVITYGASNGQISPGVVSDMRKVFQDALNQI